MKRLSKSELRELQRAWYEPGGILEESGFEDLESFRPHLYGKREPLLGKGPRHVSLDTLLPSLEGTLPEDHPLFHFRDTPQATRYEMAGYLALRAVMTRQPWEFCVALALFSEGMPERAIARTMGRSRNKLRSLLEPLKDGL